MTLCKSPSVHENLEDIGDDPVQKLHRLYSSCRDLKKKVINLKDVLECFFKLKQNFSLNKVNGNNFLYKIYSFLYSYIKNCLKSAMRMKELNKKYFYKFQHIKIYHLTIY